MKMTTKFRKSLQEKKMIVAVGVINPLTARIAEDLGFTNISVEGSQTGQATGIIEPLANAYDYINFARPIIDSVNIPVTVEGCAGFGDAVHTYTTVKQYIQAGIAAIHIEDAVFPKRMGYWERPQKKYVIPLEEAIVKFKAAVKARDEFDEDFVILMRTDAYGAVGGGLKETIKRCKAFRDIGADIVMSMAYKNKEHMKQIIEEVSGVPLHINDGSGLSVKEAEAMGYNYYNFISPVAAVAYNAVRQILKEIKEQGKPIEQEFRAEIWAYVNSLWGVPKLIEMEKEQEKILGLPPTIYHLKE
ncbi:isocitrate lyase/PEP mutase family protein [Candidatus Pacearchaeota archaeon]|nr:isocitrate lyase/PEP mutase family protein [Candidatus Pacearchaeota archaeon]